MEPTVLTQFASPHGPTVDASSGIPRGAAVRARTTRDVVAAVPYLLGYRPEESLVVVCVTGGGVVGLVARVLLADLVAPGTGASPPGAAEVRARLVPAVRGVGAVAVVAVVHSARDPREVRALVGPVLDGLEAVCDVDPWLVAPTGYRGLECEDPSCCPPQGHPPAGLEHGAINAALVAAGRAVAPSWEAAHRVPPAPEALRGRAARAARRASRADGAPVARRRAAGLDLWRELVRHAAHELRADPVDVPELPPARLGRLAAALADVGVRDAVLLSLVPGGESVADRTVAGDPRGGGGSEVEGPDGVDVEVATARAVARIVDPRVAVAPDPGTAAAARVVLEQVVAHVPRRWHAPPLTLLGLLAWWQGEGGLAAHRVAGAIEVDPQHRLAALLSGVLAAAVPPGWVRARGSGSVPPCRSSSDS